MSASVKLTSDRLRQVSAFLDALTKATRETGVTVCAYQRDSLVIDGQVLAFNWSEENGYFIDEQVGAVTLLDCPRCAGELESEPAEVQTRIGDVQPAELVRCPKCGYEGVDLSKGHAEVER